MARPTDTGSFAEAVYAQLAPVAAPYDEINGWALLIFVAAIGQMFQQFDELAHSDDIDGPWTRLLDINRIPDVGVPWLGQFYGIEVDTALSVDDQRQQIRDLETWQRGTVGAIKREILRSGGLIGNQSIIIRERDTSAYHFHVITYPNETIGDIIESYSYVYTHFTSYADVYSTFSTYADMYYGEGERRVYNAILKSKPAGLQFLYTVEYPVDYWAIWTDFPTYQQVYNIFPTYAGIYNYNSPVGSGSPGLVENSLYTNTLTYQQLWNDEQLYDDIYDTYTKY